jgi:hypothetical protein
MSAMPLLSEQHLLSDLPHLSSRVIIFVPKKHFENDKKRNVILNEARSGLYYVAIMMSFTQDFET